MQRGMVMGSFFAMRILTISAALERSAASSFFDVKSEMQSIPFVPGQANWAEVCFHSCRMACVNRDEADQPLDSLQTAMGWTEQEDCDYRCLQACISGDVDRGGRQWKHRGKWPHVRAVGLRGATVHPFLGELIRSPHEFWKKVPIHGLSTLNVELK